MIHVEPAEHGLPVRNRDVEWAVVPQQHRVVQVVHRDDLAKAPARAEDVADLHGDVGLDVPFARAGNALCCQQRVPDDKAGLHLLVMVVVAAVIVIAQRVEAVRLHHPLLRGGDGRGPVELLFGRRLHAQVGRGIAGDFEEGFDLFALLFNLLLRHLPEVSVKVAHLQQLHMQPELALEHRKIAVHIQHAGVVVAEEAKSCVLHGALDARRAHPLLDLAPRALRLRHVRGHFVRHADLRRFR